MIFTILGIRARIKIQTFSMQAQHLCDSILYDHSLIDIEFIKKDGTLKFIIRIVFIFKSMGHK